MLFRSPKPDVYLKVIEGKITTPSPPPPDNSFDLSGAVVTVLFVLFVFATPTHDLKILWFTYPANTSALVSLVSFGVSGIYLSFFLTVLGAGIARARGWVPEGKFQLGKWAWPVTLLGAGYLGAMFIDVVYPSGLSSARAFINLDWITLFIIFLIAVVGGLYLLLARPDRNVARRLEGGANAAPEAPPVTTA